ncbi:hypothetical protein DFH09DRAFT_1416307, partial [Mycena vulgaris]
LIASDKSEIQHRHPRGPNDSPNSQSFPGHVDEGEVAPARQHRDRRASVNSRRKIHAQFSFDCWWPALVGDHVFGPTTTRLTSSISSAEVYVSRSSSGGSSSSPRHSRSRTKIIQSCLPNERFRQYPTAEGEDAVDVAPGEDLADDMFVEIMEEHVQNAPALPQWPDDSYRITSKWPGNSRAPGVIAGELQTDTCNWVIRESIPIGLDRQSFLSTVNLKSNVRVSRLGVRS